MQAAKQHLNIRSRSITHTICSVYGCNYFLNKKVTLPYQSHVDVMHGVNVLIPLRVNYADDDDYL